MPTNMGNTGTTTTTNTATVTTTTTTTAVRTTTTTAQTMCTTTTAQTTTTAARTTYTTAQTTTTNTKTNTTTTLSPRRLRNQKAAIQRSSSLSSARMTRPRKRLPRKRRATVTVTATVTVMGRASPTATEDFIAFGRAVGRGPDVPTHRVLPRRFGPLPRRCHRHRRSRVRSASVLCLHGAR